MLLPENLDIALDRAGRELARFLLISIGQVSATDRFGHVSPPGQVSRAPLAEYVIVLMQEQLRISGEFRPADREKNAVGARGRRHAAMKFCVARMLDNDYAVDRFLEHMLDRRGHGARQPIAAPKPPASARVNRARVFRAD